VLCPFRINQQKHPVQPGAKAMVRLTASVVFPTPPLRFPTVNIIECDPILKKSQKNKQAIYNRNINEVKSDVIKHPKKEHLDLEH
jgi:hypothetical protein